MAVIGGCCNVFKSCSVHDVWSFLVLLLWLVIFFLTKISWNRFRASLCCNHPLDDCFVRKLLCRCVATPTGDSPASLGVALLPPGCLECVLAFSFVAWVSVYLNKRLCIFFISAEACVGRNFPFTHYLKIHNPLFEEILSQHEMLSLVPVVRSGLHFHLIVRWHPLPTKSHIPPESFQLRRDMVKAIPKPSLLKEHWVFICTSRLLKCLDTFSHPHSILALSLLIARTRIPVRSLCHLLG